ncbi:hypothetical protein Tsubulata_018206, partial [Turnera subulata]
MQGQIPETLSQLRSLRLFNVWENNLTGQLPYGLYNISSIEAIDVSDNQLNGSIPSDIGLTLPRLYYLNIQNNSFTGLIRLTLSNASTFETIVLGLNYLRGPIPKDLGSLPQLKVLAFAQNQVEDDLNFIKSLTNCSHLRSISIQQNFLTGHIPKFIANLSANLRAIDLGFKRLRSAIIIEIEYLIGLERLFLNDNFLSGPIHHINFTRLQRLERLSVEGNKLSGSIPSTIGNLGILSFLGMGFNNFDGEIPPSLGSCRSLVALDLSHNNLGGSIPKELLSLESISIDLDLSSNRLIGSLPPEIGRLQILGSLSVSHNKLVGIIPDSIAGCLGMEELYLGGNYFSGEIPQALSSLRGLSILDVSCNNLSSQIPEFLSRQLTFLNLSMNQLQGEIPKNGIFLNASAVSIFGSNVLLDDDMVAHVGDFGLAEIVSTISGGESSSLAIKGSIGYVAPGITPTDPRLKDGLHLHVFVQRALPHQVMEIVDEDILYERRNHAYTECLLSVLTIGIHCAMTHPEDRMKIKDTLSNASKLEQIDFADNHLRGPIPKDLWRLQQLQFLVFRGNQLKDDLSFINSLINCSHLVAIDIQQDLFNGQIPKFIANLSVELWFIGLANNQLCGAIPIEIESLTGLEFLILKHNYLRGPIHHINFTRLQRLERLTVEGNKLSGSIPSTIGNLGCSSVEELYLDGNYFAGEISHALSSLQGLKILDISRNNLSGQIPNFLSRLTLVNLSMNQLQGEVPKQGIFQNASAVSLFGNKDLCGGFSQLKLSSCLNTERKKSNLHLIWKISIPIMFTGISPTDPRFTDDLHLHIFVQRALPHEVMEIVDQNILYERRNHAYTGCLLSLLTIGIQCSMTHPEDRMKIKD